MKNITLLLSLMLISAKLTAQENEENIYTQDVEKKYELKISAFNLIAFASVDASYERLINEDSSYGFAVFYNFSDYEDDDIGNPKKNSNTPYYRWFFSENKYARGFFIEGFGMLNTCQDYYRNYDSYDYNNNYDRVETQTGFALGISVEGKFVTNKVLQQNYS
jgi:hypothetical protein